MSPKLKRIGEITIGVLLVLLGVVMIFTPGQGSIVIVIGIMFISPYHGRRVLWRLKMLWKRTKTWWYSWRYKRTVKRVAYLKKKRNKQYRKSQIADPKNLKS